MDSPTDLTAAFLAEFSTGAINLVIWAAVVLAGLVCRWRPWPVRATGAALGLGMGVVASLIAGSWSEAVVAIAGSILGALVVAELMLSVIAPVARFLWTCCAVAVDVVVGTARHIMAPDPPVPPDPSRPADDRRTGP